MCSRKSESEGVITFRCNHEVTHMYDACMHDMHNACMHACLPASTYVRAYIQTNKRRNDGTNEQTHTHKHSIIHVKVYMLNAQHRLYYSGLNRALKGMHAGTLALICTYDMHI